MIPEQPLLECRDVVSGYLPGVDIVRGSDLTLAEGELVGIIGPNGAGKSTLLKTIFGLVELRSGSIKLRNEDISDLPAHELVQKGVGFVPQTDNVFPSLTVEENLQMGCYLKPGLFRERANFVANLFHSLSERKNQRVGAMSGGERQMVAMGRALMMNPSVLLLDEPSADAVTGTLVGLHGPHVGEGELRR